jgi:Membrane fusion protein Use1
VAQAEEQERQRQEQEKNESQQQSVNVPNESLSVLRNRLFTNKDQDEPTDTSTEHVLQHHRMLQDDLSESMLGMARGLKERSIAFGDALKEDSKVYRRYQFLMCSSLKTLPISLVRIRIRWRRQEGDYVRIAERQRV